MKRIEGVDRICYIKKNEKIRNKQGYSVAKALSYKDSKND